MLHYRYLALILIPLSVVFFSNNYTNDSKNICWGFYAHKLINKMAVFTLPEELIEFYKSNIDYIEEHAVDPDKRRYALHGEAIRHYIDLDHWEQLKSSPLPQDITSAMIHLNHFYLIHEGRQILLFDTLFAFRSRNDSLMFSDELKNNTNISEPGVKTSDFKFSFTKSGLNHSDHNDEIVSAELFCDLFPFVFQNDFISMENRFNVHGILPYHLEKVYRQLTDAFKTKSKSRILRLSADIGHYLGDAHVPLHTSENYNGQLTNQEGIHAFWESRIPELFAESDFDFLVGPAEYIPDIRNFIWNIITESHSGVKSVLSNEKNLSSHINPDQQYCYDERLGHIIKIQCRDYAKKYNELLDNQVEDRMRASIYDLGCIWMSAWVEAGQPNLNDVLQDNQIDSEIQIDSSLLNELKFKIREHE